MKTILYMTLTANGYFAQADKTHAIPKEILGDLSKSVGITGNIINGRRTYLMGRQSYDLLRRQAAQKNLAIEVVIVSDVPLEDKGICVVGSPQEALEHLDQKGLGTALVAGGGQLDSAFLSQGLVDEIYLNILPTMANNGGVLATTGGLEADLLLLGTTKLSDNILQLHYRVARQ
jgi:dihydrofolate reductase